MFSPLVITFSIYLAVILGIGVIAYRYTSNLSDYILGGRSLTGPVAALSAGSADMSGWLMMALPGAVYMVGLAEVWMPIGLCVGALLNWLLVAKRLRIYTVTDGNTLTIPAYLDHRFGDGTPLLKIIPALVILFFFVFYTAAGIIALGLLLENLFGWPYEYMIWIGGISVLLFTFVGGFLGVSWTDFFQGLLMLVALLTTPLAAVWYLGGFSETLDQIRSIDTQYFSSFFDVDFVTKIGLLAWGLGYFGQPHVLARFMAIRSIKEVPLAAAIHINWMVLALAGAILTGFVGIAYFANTPLAREETVFILLTEALFNPWIAGILIAAIIAAIVSTANAQVLVCASVIVDDFYKSYFRPHASQNEFVLVARIVVSLVVLIAVLLATNPEHKILNVVAFAWAGFGASFGPVMILSLFWKRMTRNAALAGMSVGAIVVSIWGFITTPTGIFSIYEIIPGFLFSTIAIIVTTLLDKEPPESIQKTFDKVMVLIKQ